MDMFVEVNLAGIWRLSRENFLHGEATIEEERELFDALDRLVGIEGKL